MQTDDRIRSEFNTGTVKSIGESSVAIVWDGFAGPIAVSLEIAKEFQVVSK